MKKYTQKNTKNEYTDNWSTPLEIYNQFMKQNYYDPCKLYDNSFTFNLDIDFGNMFINPPYSNIKEWTKYAINYHKFYKRKIVMLLPSRTGTKWFHELLNYGIEINFIKGRLKFGNSKNSAPFDSIFIILNGKENIIIEDKLKK